jgi:hypothetical protein
MSTTNAFLYNGPTAVVLVFCNTLLALLWFLLHEFHHKHSFPSQKTGATSFLAENVF